MTDLTAIKAALALGPTPGGWLLTAAEPWTSPTTGELYQHGRFDISANTADPDAADYYRIASVSNVNNEEQNRANGMLMVACSPDTIAALVAEVEQLRADARRYRHLSATARRGAANHMNPGFVEVSFTSWCHEIGEFPDLGAAIDAAMAQGEQG